jgi:hypothetical protein
MATHTREKRPMVHCYVDAKGGAYAAIAAALSPAVGLGPALAASTVPVSIPAEVGVVLGEIGLALPKVLAPGEMPADARPVVVSSSDPALHAGEGELERLAMARIIRDRTERRLLRKIGKDPR